MFDWLRRIFQSQKESERQHFFETIDALNAEGGGGRPTATAAFLGTLELRSKTLALGDPQYVPGLEVPNIDANEVLISASLWRYPSGAETLTALTLRLGDAHHRVSHRKIGEIGIDSAKLVVTDKIDIDQHWTEIGKERIGIISTAPDDTVLLMLTKHFGLKTIRVNPVRAEVVGPVSEALEMEIENYLKSQPR